MKNLFYILFITATNVLFSQNAKDTPALKNILVEYTFNDNFFYEQFNAKLISNGRVSKYYTKFSNDKDDNAELRGNDIFIGKRIDIYQTINKSTDTLVSYETINGKHIYAIAEKTPNLKWEINHNEVKKINKYQCNKATVVFRGRKYTAWYTKEIPISSGPWKFNGLLGLILQISDDTKTYSWSVRKISYPTKETITIPYKKTKNVSIKEYVVLVKEDLEMTRARIRSILPREAVVSTPKNFRNGLELVYEWEVD